MLAVLCSTEIPDGAAIAVTRSQFRQRARTEPMGIDQGICASILSRSLGDEIVEVVRLHSAFPEALTIQGGGVRQNGVIILLG
ncbi:MAG TPA: hypothetical protein VHZ33_21325 [Trebonia sp.]|jgi:hypothetical protein|nr:hypothetical protein [Trebonia sp.]